MAFQRWQAQGKMALDVATVAMLKVQVHSTFTESYMHEFHLPDMTCSHCASKVNVTVKLLDPACEIQVDLPQRLITV